MAVTSAGIGLPEFDQSTGNALATLVDHAAVDQNPRADRHLAGPRIVQNEVVIELADHVVTKDGAGDLAFRAVERD